MVFYIYLKSKNIQQIDIPMFGHKRGDMKTLIFILMFLSLTHQGWSQETNQFQTSDILSIGRYEIVQGELVVSITFKIDKYLGRVYQLVMDENELLWRLMYVENQDIPTLPSLNKVNYQIFTTKMLKGSASDSGVGITFLLNVNTGATWRLVKEQTSGELFWTSM